MRSTTMTLACIGALALGGCERSQSTAEAQETEREPPQARRETQSHEDRHTAQVRQARPAAQHQQPPRMLSTAQIAGVLDVVNAAEIREARLARARARTADVRHFAEEMLSDHTQAQQRSRRANREGDIVPCQTEVTERMEREAEATMDILRRERDAFDRAYIEAQVDEHRDVVALLDANMPNVEDPRYRQLLTQQRDAIDHHRQMAERIQVTLEPRASR